MRGYNSTIRAKCGFCQHPGCKTYGPLTKKLCGIHYWASVKIKSVARMEEKELVQNESLSAVIEDLDAVYSQYIRLKASDENGYCKCYGCPKVQYWTEMHCCHYISRTHMNTRFLEENTFCGCVECNRQHGGRLSSYSVHFGNLIERNRPGGVDALEEQARIEYNYSVSEVKEFISHYSKRVREMKKKKPLKI